MSKLAAVLRHVAFEDLGSLAPVLEGRGFTVRYHDAGVDRLGAVDPLGPDLVVVLGGPIGACDDDAYPFLKEELALLQGRLAADRPTLGICLGAQLVARALDARVYPGPAKEIGWAPITLTDAGESSCLRHVGSDGVAVLHWHGDTFDLPDGATRLASTEVCANQAFAWGERTLALQFHIEATAAGLERWLIGHAVEIAATPGVTVGALREGARRFGAELEARARKCLGEWLDRVR